MIFANAGKMRGSPQGAMRCAVFSTAPRTHFMLDDASSEETETGMESRATDSWLAAAAGLAGKLMLVALFWWDVFFLLIPDFSGTAGYIGQRGLPFPEVLAVAAIVMLLVLPAMVFFRKTAAAGYLGLSLFCLFTAVVFHQYWTLDGGERVMEQIQFMKNLALAGALLMIFGYIIRRTA